MRQYKTAVAMLLIIGVSGCANRRVGPCALAGGLLGATVGAVGAGFAVDQVEPTPSRDEIAAGAGGGFLAGGLIGSVLGHLICDPEAEPPPPPPSAPPPPPPPPSKGTKIATVGEAYFDFDKAELKPSAEDVLREAVKTLKDNPDLRVVVEGHTDSIGSEQYNLRLSEKRAEAVKRYLVRQGNDPSRITTRGYGESRPIEDNSSREGRAKNRRAEIVVD